MSKNLFTTKKLRRISATNGGNKVKSVIYGGVYVGNDTSHDGRGRAAVIKPSCQKSPKGFFDSLKPSHRKGVRAFCLKVKAGYQNLLDMSS